MIDGTIRHTRGPVARSMAQSPRPDVGADREYSTGSRSPPRQPTPRSGGQDWEQGRNECLAIVDSTIIVPASEKQENFWWCSRGTGISKRVPGSHIIVYR